MADTTSPIQIIGGLIAPSEFRFTGFGKLSGTLAVGPTESPASRVVRLYDRATGKLVAETRSSSLGAYTFNNIDPSRQYTALGLDDLPIVYEADAADGLTATPVRPAT